MNEEEIQKLLKQHQGKYIVAWRFWSGDWQYVCDKRMLHCLTDDVFVEPLFLAPNKWQGLTDEEIKEIVGPYGDTPIKGYTRKLFDQIEAQLRSKNI
jgi:hypothetical protein